MTADAGSAAIDDWCDSFDDDLGWILEKLTDRASGSFGLIVRFVDSIEPPVLMARTAIAEALPDSAIAQITGQLRRRQCEQSVLQTQSPSSGDSFSISSIPDTAIRLLHMTFQPAPGVGIVAAVGCPESSSTLLRATVVRRLYPVLARYIRLWWMHRTERRRASSFESALDIAELGIALLDRHGQLLYANAYVRKILDDGDGLRCDGRALLPANPADASRLHVAIQHALLRNAATSREGGLQAPLILLRRGEARRALIVTALPHRGRAVDPGDAAAIMYVLHPERDVSKCLTPVYRIYSLTPAEARLVTALVAGANLLQAASGMNVTLATVRAQLKQVFEKTRTNRQAELVRVMLASAVRSAVGVDFTLVR